MHVINNLNSMTMCIQKKKERKTKQNNNNNNKLNKTKNSMIIATFIRITQSEPKANQERNTNETKQTSVIDSVGTHV